jgi:hypothetical protein
MLEEMLFVLLGHLNILTQLKQFGHHKSVLLGFGQLVLNPDKQMVKRFKL